MIAASVNSRPAPVLCVRKSRKLIGCDSSVSFQHVGMFGIRDCIRDLPSSWGHVHL